MKNMGWLFKTLYICVIIGMIGAAIIQVFLPQIMGESSGYGLSSGWQREIGFWNCGMITILILTYIYGDEKTIKIVCFGNSIMGILFGLNHFHSYFLNTNNVGNLVGGIENFTFVFILCYCLFLKNKTTRTFSL